MVLLDRISALLKELNTNETEQINPTTTILNRQYQLFKKLRKYGSDNVTDSICKTFIECCLMYLKNIINYTFHNNLLTKKNISHVTNWVNVLTLIPYFEKQPGYFLLEEFVTVMEIITDLSIPFWCNLIIIRKFIDIIRDSEKKILDEVINRNKIYLYKVVDMLSCCGDFELQSVVLEMMFLLCSPGELKLLAEDFFPEDKELSKAFTSINILKFDLSIRRFLNLLNTKSSLVFSVVCALVCLDTRSFDSLKEYENQNGLWVDFSLNIKTVSFFCNKSSLQLLPLSQSSSGVEEWEMIRITENNIERIKYISKKNNVDSYVLIQFYLKDEIITRHENLEHLAKAKTLKLLLKESEETKYLLQHVLPLMYPEKFSDGSQSITSQSDYDNSQINQNENYVLEERKEVIRLRNKSVVSSISDLDGDLQERIKNSSGIFTKSVSPIVVSPTSVLFNISEKTEGTLVSTLPSSKNKFLKEFNNFVVATKKLQIIKNLTDETDSTLSDGLDSIKICRSNNEYYKNDDLIEISDSENEIEVEALPIISEHNSGSKNDQYFSVSNEANEFSNNIFYTCSEGDYSPIIELNNTETNTSNVKILEVTTSPMEDKRTEIVNKILKSIKEDREIIKSLTPEIIIKKIDNKQTSVKKYTDQENDFNTNNSVVLDINKLISNDEVIINVIHGDESREEKSSEAKKVDTFQEDEINQTDEQSNLFQEYEEISNDEVIINVIHDDESREEKSGEAKKVDTFQEDEINQTGEQSNLNKKVVEVCTLKENYENQNKAECENIYNKNLKRNTEKMQGEDLVKENDLNLLIAEENVNLSESVKVHAEENVITDISTSFSFNDEMNNEVSNYSIEANDEEKDRVKENDLNLLIAEENVNLSENVKFHAEENVTTCGSFSFDDETNNQISNYSIEVDDEDEPLIDINKCLLVNLQELNPSQEFLKIFSQEKRQELKIIENNQIPAVLNYEHQFQKQLVVIIERNSIIEQKLKKKVEPLEQIGNYKEILENSNDRGNVNVNNAGKLLPEYVSASNLQDVEINYAHRQSQLNISMETNNVIVEEFLEPPQYDLENYQETLKNFNITTNDDKYMDDSNLEDVFDKSCTAHSQDTETNYTHQIQSNIIIEPNSTLEEKLKESTEETKQFGVENYQFLHTFYSQDSEINYTHKPQLYVLIERNSILEEEIKESVEQTKQLDFKNYQQIFHHEEKFYSNVKNLTTTENFTENLQECTNGNQTAELICTPFSKQKDNTEITSFENDKTSGTEIFQDVVYTNEIFDTSINLQESSGNCSQLTSKSVKLSDEIQKLDNSLRLSEVTNHQLQDNISDLSEFVNEIIEDVGVDENVNNLGNEELNEIQSHTTDLYEHDKREGKVEIDISKEKSKSLEKNMHQTSESEFQVEAIQENSISGDYTKSPDIISAEDSNMEMNNVNLLTELNTFQDLIIGGVNDNTKTSRRGMQIIENLKITSPQKNHLVGEEKRIGGNSEPTITDNNSVLFSNESEINSLTYKNQSKSARILEVKNYQENINAKITKHDTDKIIQKINKNVDFKMQNSHLNKPTKRKLYTFHENLSSEDENKIHHQVLIPKVNNKNQLINSETKKIMKKMEIDKSVKLVRKNLDLIEIVTEAAEKDEEVMDIEQKNTTKKNKLMKAKKCEKENVNKSQVKTRKQKTKKYLCIYDSEDDIPLAQLNKLKKLKKLKNISLKRNFDESVKPLKFKCEELFDALIGKPSNDRTENKTVQKRKSRKRKMDCDTILRNEDTNTSLKKRSKLIPSLQEDSSSSPLPDLNIENIKLSSDVSSLNVMNFERHLHSIALEVENNTSLENLNIEAITTEKEIISDQAEGSTSSTVNNGEIMSWIRTGSNQDIERVYQVILDSMKNISDVLTETFVEPVSPNLLKYYKTFEKLQKIFNNTKK